MEKSCVEIAIDAAGGVTKLANALNISSQAVSQWMRVPAERVLEIERVTGGRASRHQLRPDLYPLDQPREAPTPESVEGAAA